MISSIGVIKARKRMWTFDCLRPNCFEAWNWNILSVTSGGSQVDYYHWYDFLSLSTHSVVVATKSSPLAGILSKNEVPNAQTNLNFFLCNVTVTMWPKLQIILGEKYQAFQKFSIGLLFGKLYFSIEVNTISLNVLECVHLLVIKLKHPI